MGLARNVAQARGASGGTNRPSGCGSAARGSAGTATEFLRDENRTVERRNLFVLPDQAAWAAMPSRRILPVHRGPTAHSAAVDIGANPEGATGVGLVATTTTNDCCATTPPANHGAAHAAVRVEDLVITSDDCCATTSSASSSVLAGLMGLARNAAQAWGTSSGINCPPASGSAARGSAGTATKFLRDENRTVERRNPFAPPDQAAWAAMPTRRILPTHRAPTAHSAVVAIGASPEGSTGVRVAVVISANYCCVMTLPAEHGAVQAAFVEADFVTTIDDCRATTSSGPVATMINHNCAAAAQPGDHGSVHAAIQVIDYATTLDDCYATILSAGSSAQSASSVSSAGCAGATALESCYMPAPLLGAEAQTADEFLSVIAVACHVRRSDLARHNSASVPTMPAGASCTLWRRYR